MNINNKPTGKLAPVKKLAVKKATIAVTKVLPKALVPNRFMVPVRLWKSFGENGQKVFNEVYDTVFNQTKQSNFNHPKQVELPKEQWKTLCWNFSCEAAWATKKL